MICGCNWTAEDGVTRSGTRESAAAVGMVGIGTIVKEGCLLSIHKMGQ